MAVVNLNGNWDLTWKPMEGCSDVPACASPIMGAVPGDVHEDLIAATLLPEPLIGANAPLHAWVERAQFSYEREFTAEGDFDRAELVFHGLDCFANIYVDSALIGSSSNAFVEHVFDVTNVLTSGNIHKLRVDLDTGVEWAKTQDTSEYRAYEDKGRLFLRKPQFSFKWDWAPRLVTCGIWRTVELRLYKHATIRDMALTPKFNGDDAMLTAALNVEAYSPGDYLLRLRVVRGPMVWQRVEKITLGNGIGQAEVSALVTSVERWFPVGYGDQPLYSVEVEIERDGVIVDSQSTTYGFREVRLRQDPIGDGETTFIVNINGIDTFCKGANWVPVDSIIARVTDQKYEALIKEAVAANFNMLRIWGGGIYESDVFYDLCDRYGIMIWHDFMFACGEYPDKEQWFMDNVKDEAEKAVRRLRHHPSIALWCGNNENDWCFGYMTRGENKRLADFPGQTIGHKLLPVVCAELDPQRPYWPSSPFGGEDPNSEALGDRHAWNVSILGADWETRADIRNYRKEHGKFNSEYGMISHALPRSIKQYTVEKNIDFTSEAYKFHDNPANTREPNTPTLTDWNLKTFIGRVPTDPLEYVNHSLAYQAMGYREAISNFRIQMPNCAGSLFWMYSDCWGTLGWTIIDYYLRRKPSFYWVKKAYAPLAVFARVEDNVAHSYVINDTQYEIPVTVILEVGDMTGKGEGVSEDIMAPPYSVTVGPDIECGKGYAYARIEKGNRVRSEDIILTHFPAEMEIPEVNIDFEIKQSGGELVVTVTSDGFAHFVNLEMADKAVPSDNYFNLLPSRPKIIRVANTISGEIGVSALNMR